ncbi:MAG: hypothetical protein U9M90_00215 [Patescibacteria group bacterium]|nr:hypothetical protein [Patescibacteria group bacterium]
MLACIFWRKKKLALLAYSGLIINGVAWGLLFWVLPREQAGIIMHYNAFLGIDLFLSTSDPSRFFEIFFAPIGGICFYLMNLIVAMILLLFTETKQGAQRVETEDISKQQNDPDPGGTYRFGAYLVLSGNLVLQIAILIYSVAIVMVNY